MGNVQTAKELLTWLEKVDPEMLLFTGGLFGIEDFTISNGEEERQATPEQFRQLDDSRAIEKQIDHLSQEIFEFLDEVVMADWNKENE